MLDMHPAEQHFRSVLTDLLEKVWVKEIKFGDDNRITIFIDPNTPCSYMQLIKLAGTLTRVWPTTCYSNVEVLDGHFVVVFDVDTDGPLSEAEREKFRKLVPLHTTQVEPTSKYA
jgi:hypothetical protein